MVIPHAILMKVCFSLLEGWITSNLIRFGLFMFGPWMENWDKNKIGKGMRRKRVFHLKE